MVVRKGHGHGCANKPDKETFCLYWLNSLQRRGRVELCLFSVGWVTPALNWVAYLNTNVWVGRDVHVAFCFRTIFYDINFSGKAAALHYRSNSSWFRVRLCKREAEVSVGGREYDSSLSKQSDGCLSMGLLSTRLIQIKLCLCQGSDTFLR